MGKMISLHITFIKLAYFLSGRKHFIYNRYGKKKENEGANHSGCSWEDILERLC